LTSLPRHRRLYVAVVDAGAAGVLDAVDDRSPEKAFAALAREHVVVEAVRSLAADFAQLVAEQLWGRSLAMDLPLHPLCVVQIFQILLNFSFSFEYFF